MPFKIYKRSEYRLNCKKTVLLFTIFCSLSFPSIGQPDTAMTSITKNASDRTPELFVSLGYNYCRYHFLDAGLRYYSLKTDGQTMLAFGGFALGCEFSMNRPEQAFIPYLGVQGQRIGIAYGLRLEYGISRDQQSIGLMPEFGFSVFEMLRITGGYRYCFKNDPLALNGFRLSVIIGFPTSLFEK